MNPLASKRQRNRVNVGHGRSPIVCKKLYPIPLRRCIVLPLKAMKTYENYLNLEGGGIPIGT